MKHAGADLVLVGFTISFHIAGMYAFSPVFGWLADKLGRIQIVISGQVIYVAALIIAGTAGMNHFQITVGLFLLGLGWSAATVAGSALLSTSLPANQKTNVQGVSDSTMMLAGALGGAVSGSILAAGAFLGLNMAALVPVCIALAITGLAIIKQNA
jgi:MFS family permease